MFWMAAKMLISQHQPTSKPTGGAINKKTGDTTIKPGMNKGNNTEKNNAKGGLKRDVEDMANYEVLGKQLKKEKVEGSQVDKIGL